MSATMTHPNASRLDQLDRAITAREDEERAVHTGEHFDIRELAVETMRRKYMGYMVLLTGDASRGLPFVGAFIDFRGKTVETTFSEYATPEAALSALLATSRAK